MALDFSSLPTPPGRDGVDSSASLVPASPRPATSMDRARQVLQRSRERDWAAAPQLEVVAEVERLQALLGGMIAAAESAPGFGGMMCSSPEEGRKDEKSRPAADDTAADDANEEEGWSVSRLLFG